MKAIEAAEAAAKKYGITVAMEVILGLRPADPELKEVVTPLRSHMKMLAIQAGIQDLSYQTVRYGLVASFRGEVKFCLQIPGIWPVWVKAEGYEPSGDAQFLECDGGIKFSFVSQKGS